MELVKPTRAAGSMPSADSFDILHASVVTFEQHRGCCPEVSVRELAHKAQPSLRMEKLPFANRRFVLRRGSGIGSSSAFFMAGHIAGAAGFSHN